MNRFTRLNWAVSALVFVLIAGMFTFWENGWNQTNHTSASPYPERGTLDRPYTDWRQQEVPFGTSSFDLAPWRAYMDTWDANRYLETLGINFNVGGKEADATAQLLAEAGFHSARVEVGWGNISFENENKLREPQGKNFQILLQALKKHGIRPIILLNANSGNPVPNQNLDLELKKSAKKGSREIYVNSTKGIVPHYTGLTGQAYQTMYPVITAVNAKTGKLTLSAPLTKDLKRGDLRLIRLKYRPFSGTIYADGSINPAAKETINGWTTYLQTLTGFLKQTLGTEKASDAGFDLEVWNEMTFGSQFLGIEQYYDPKPQFSEYPTYTLAGRTAKGPEVLLPITVQFVNNAKKKLPGVRVISGFANQRPWENGVELFEGQTGFSRHYYTGYNGESSVFKESSNTAKRKYMSATGATLPGTDSFLPTHVYAMPEYWFYAYHTEFVVRDLQPFPGPFKNHFRYANPDNGHQAEVWMTESNWWRWPFTQKIMRSANLLESNPQLHSLMQEIGAKASLRMFTFSSHKGVKTINMYAAKAGDLSYGVISDAFFKELAASQFKLTDRARKAAGPQIEALTNMAKLMRSGVKIDNPRNLTVTNLVEKEERIVWKGDGTEEHPDVHNRDDFAVLPFQLHSNKFAVGYYVVTRDLTKEWQPVRNVLDAQRYAMPAQKFVLTLSNVAGERASVYAYDPITNQKIPASIKSKSANTLTVEVESTDYPRFLIIEENKAKTGPVISGTKLDIRNGSSSFTFEPNAAGTAVVSWGAYPVRSGGSFEVGLYPDMESLTPTKQSQAPMIRNETPSLSKGIWKWSGTIVPEHTETYSFIADTNLCRVILQINERMVINGCKDSARIGTVELLAGQKYDLDLTMVSTSNDPQRMTLYWASPSTPKSVVPAFADGKQSKTVRTKPGVPVTVALPGFKTGDGVKVDFKSDEEGLTAKFPQWSFDVRGVWWPKTKAQ